jgi:hypothetical protein
MYCSTEHLEELVGSSVQIADVKIREFLHSFYGEHVVVSLSQVQK